MTQRMSRNDMIKLAKRTEAAIAQMLKEEPARDDLWADHDRWEVEINELRGQLCDINGDIDDEAFDNSHCNV